MKNTQIDNPKYVDVVIIWFNIAILIPKTSRRLWQY